MIRHGGQNSAASIMPKEKRALLATITEQARTGSVTLLYSAKDERHNQAVALQNVLRQQTGSRNPLALVRHA
jgi:hypothetical protein